MNVGVFSPVINLCGGAEWVGINIITALKENGYRVIVLSDKPLDQNRFRHVFGRKLLVDEQMIFPLRFFSQADYRNIYTDAIRCLVLKSKCDVVVDTFSEAVLPGVSVSYIHYPLLKRVNSQMRRSGFFFYPYRSYLTRNKNNYEKKLLFANSSFCADAIRSELGVNPHILYPPVSTEILTHNFEDFEKQRVDNVVTISRICRGKGLEKIPHIAKSMGGKASFTIIGLLDSQEVLSSIRERAKDLKVSERIRIVTNAKREQLRRILLDSKVYLHTKENEHFGISIVEAMASGCIPVVHNSGGPKEFVPSNLRFSNIDEAADILEKAIDSWSANQAKRLSTMAEKFSENNFSKRFINTFQSYFSGSI